MESCFIEMAQKICDASGQVAIGMWLAAGDVESAKGALVDRVDICFARGMPLYEAAELYHLLGVSEKRSTEFPQLCVCCRHPK